MFRITLPLKRTSDKGFTLIESMTASVIALYVMLAAWALYTMGWSWWHEIAPRVEAERIARSALSNIIIGRVDSTAGMYNIGTVNYSRRNGLLGATAVPTISTSQQEIDFALEPDASNVRSFYLGTDAVTGENLVYYQDSTGTDHPIETTRGITDLRFEKVLSNDNLIRVTASVQRTITGTRSGNYNIAVTYNEVVCLRNVQ